MLKKETMKKKNNSYKASILLFSVHPVLKEIIFVFGVLNKDLKWVKKKNYNKDVIADLGGRRDKTDIDLEYTAAREFFEESLNYNITNKKKQTVSDIYVLLKDKKYFCRVENTYNNRKYVTYLVETPFNDKLSFDFLLKRQKLLKRIKKKKKTRQDQLYLNEHNFIYQNLKDMKYYVKSAFNEVENLCYISIDDLIRTVTNSHSKYMCLRTQANRLQDIIPIIVTVQNKLNDRIQEKSYI